MRFAHRLLVLVALVPACSASAAEPPLLALDAGGHTAVVKRVLFTPDGKELITVSHDKTIRFWDVATGEPLRVLRPPIGSGPEGMLYTAALSPDGRILAVAGYGSHSVGGSYGTIYLVDVLRGELLRRLEGHRGIINDLAFSADSRRLISGSSDLTARIWNVVSGESERTLSGHTGSVFGVVFSPDGRQAATASFDRTAAIWSTDSGERVAQLTGSTGEVRCIDWSRDGGQILTGSDDHAIRLWSSAGRLLRTFDKLGPYQFTAVRFLSSGGRCVLAGVDASGTATPRFLTGQISSTTGQIAVRVDQHDNSILDVRLSPDEKFTASTGGNDNETLLWRTADGEVTRTFVGQGRTPRAAAWNAAGEVIAWGDANVTNSRLATAPLERSFDLTRLTFGPPIPAARAGEWRRSQLEQGPLRLEVTGNTALVVRRGQDLVASLEPVFEFERQYDITRCFTFLSGDRAAVGSSYGFWICDARTGDRLRQCVGHSGEIWAVAPSPDGRYLLSAGGDNTLRIWPLSFSRSGRIPRGELGPESVKFLESVGLGKSLDDPAGFYTIANRLEAGGDAAHKRFAAQIREEYATEINAVGEGFPPLLSLFFAGDEWIAWTPEGYYAASPGGERLMGWHVNNGPDKLASFYPAAQFRKQFYRPEAIKLLLKTGSIERALRESGSNERPAELAQNLPPRIEIVAPGGPQFTTDQSELRVTVAAEQVGPHPVTSLQLLLNGRPLGGQGGVVRLDGKSAAPRHTFTVPLISGVTHRLQARADSAVSYGLSSEVAVTATSAGGGGAAGVTEKVLPALYLLAIGVADYDNGDLKLNFAAQDARNVAAAFETHSRGLYRKVETHVVTDKQATQRGILGGLNWLRRQMTQHDVGVVFFSGHGDRDEDATFYLLPSDADPEQGLLVTGVSDLQVKAILQGVPGRVLVMLDACHAGTLGGDRRKSALGLTDDLVRDLATDDYGIVTMASSMGREFSLESAAEKSGVFTLALTEGLSGKADFNGDGVVYFNELDTYVSNRVKELSQGRQHPATAKPTTVRSFPLSQPRSR